MMSHNQREAVKYSQDEGKGDQVQTTRQEGQLEKTVEHNYANAGTMIYKRHLCKDDVT
jgi:hypothetical protein